VTSGLVAPRRVDAAPAVHPAHGPTVPPHAARRSVARIGAEARVCAPPDEDFAQRLAGVGVPMVPFGRSALLRRRRGQPAGTVRPAGRRRAPRRRGHDHDGHSGRRAPGGGAPGGEPAILGWPGGRLGHRHGTRRSDSDHRVPVRRAQDDPDPRDPRTSDRRGRPIRTDGRWWPRRCCSTQPAEKAASEVLSARSAW